MRLRDNSEVASRLDEVALVLEEQQANPFRVRAYRRAADTLRHLNRSVVAVIEVEGEDGLEQLPGIGARLARSIHTLVETGRLPMLERLRGEVDPLDLLASVPGIGEVLAHRLHHDLGIDSLEDLEAAAHDGRLREVEGFGEKRLSGIRDSLAHRLARVRVHPGKQESDLPSVGELLDVDSEYRDRAGRGELQTIVPRRMNPEGRAWLPVLHTQRGERHYHALFSNTPRAHRLGAVGDWVVLYWDGAAGDGQSTVITAHFGDLEGRRIVRGRESECREYYRSDRRSETSGSEEAGGRQGG